ncbi:hypothetical protein LRS06_22845 [Hymenobacter sp. J193]|uniref:hypothetical protein n=1 Tax=Hymenobacter sp. J193 TaxID=2898429 RepID=UPI002150C9E9|nr:hypothetical protein [Hymenobacter sp. J193]MCR5890568.1 hypothetical protein [Hymenobacter sp. J193]
MKKLLLMVLLTAGVGILPASAQRHVKHLASWGAHVGRSETGDYYELSYTPMLTNRLALRLSGGYEHGTLPARGEYSVYQGRVLLSPNCSASGRWPTSICCWARAPATSGPTKMAVGS